MPLIFQIVLGKKKFTLDDFRQMDPAMAKQLEAILTIDSVEDLCLVFATEAEVSICLIYFKNVLPFFEVCLSVKCQISYDYGYAADN